MAVQRDAEIGEILLLPRDGYQVGDEAGDAKELLSAASIIVVSYEYVATHAILAVRAPESGPAIDLLARRGMMVSRPN